MKKDVAPRAGRPRGARRSLRLWIQAAFSALTNGYVMGFVQGKIYTGGTKRFCVPGLSCYSCPGALGSCPIGALQAVLGSRNIVFSFYVTGFLVTVGALVGRLACGFLCPFGLVQDLLHKIPFPGKRRAVPGIRVLRYVKYVVLLVFVIALPIFAVNIAGQGDPWFCKWICPSGTLLGGLPLVSLNEPLRGTIGWLFNWKVLLLALTVLASMLFYRPFCRVVCPLGAIYGLTNPVSLLRLRLNEAECIQCGLCAKACKMGLDPRDAPNHPECIRCLECAKACPTRALTVGFGLRGERSGCGACKKCQHDA